MDITSFLNFIDPLDIEMNLYLFFKVHDEIVKYLFSKVGDFGLARWQPDGDMGVDTRVIGTFG